MLVTLPLVLSKQSCGMCLFWFRRVPGKDRKTDSGARIHSHVVPACALLARGIIDEALRWGWMLTLVMFIIT
jgi:hypothetical protein